MNEDIYKIADSYLIENKKVWATSDGNIFLTYLDARCHGQKTKTDFFEVIKKLNNKEK